MKQEQKEDKTYKVRTPYNYVPEKGKKITGLSKTVPSQAVGLKDIVTKFVKGLPISASQQDPIWEEEDEPTNGINPKTLDLADIEQMKIQNAQGIVELQKKAKIEDQEIRAKKQAEKQAKQEEEDRRLLELLKKNQV